MYGLQTYQATQAQTASPGELVVMLYRGATRAIGAALTAFDAEDWVEVHHGLIRAQSIIAELAATLDVERGGELAENLALLYDYWLRRLVEANVQKRREPALEIQGYLRELTPAWEQASREVAAGRGRVAVAA